VERRERRWRATPPPNPPIPPRRCAGLASETLRITRSILLGRVASATQRGDDQTLVTLTREVHRNIDQWARLAGAYAPTTQQVDVTVSTSPQEIIAETERRLLALAAERQQQLPGNIIEGEVIA
jgi:hypothetical protein